MRASSRTASCSRWHAGVPELRLVPGTGEAVDDELDELTREVLIGKVRHLTALNAGLLNEITAFEIDLKSKRATIGALKGQITIQNRVDGLDGVIEGLLIHWRNTLRGPDSSVCVDIDSKRGEAVRKRLKALIKGDDDPELANPDKTAREDALDLAAQRAAIRIQAAIDGCARAPFAGAYGKRYAEAGPGRRRKDELVYIVRDEVSMERFEAIVEAEPRRLAYRAFLADEIRRSPSLRAILASLGPYCDGEILARCVRWCASQEAQR